MATDDSTTTRATTLVTGACGQVGSRVCQILLERGHTVVATDLPGTAAEDALTALRALALPGRLVVALGDLRDAAAVHDIVHAHQPTAIVHLAAIIPPPAYRSPALARTVNVDGTAHLVRAAEALATPPLLAEASSAGVYGSRNPHHHPDPVSAATPVAPSDCYGEHKVEAEAIVAASALPHVTLRLGGIISPDSLKPPTPDLGILVRAMPTDQRIQVIDARDVALAFANAVDPAHIAPEALDGKVLLIAGDDRSCRLTQQDAEDDLMEAIGIGRVGPAGRLPGDPGDAEGWGLTDWFDTTEAQDLLAFQSHTWEQTLSWLATSLGWKRRIIRLLAPLLRLVMRLVQRRQLRREGRGPYADPWRLIEAHYGDQALSGRLRAHRAKPQAA